MLAPRVFISSTFIDNEQRRKRIETAVVQAGMVPVGMERFTGSRPRRWHAGFLDSDQEQEVTIGADT